jgi:hypothetical protein
MSTIKHKRVRLISIDTNAKTVKGQKEGYLTGILYIAPANLSGYNTCALAEKAGCIAACLNTAGLGGVYSSIQDARIKKAKMFFEQREAFMHNIVKDIELLIKRAAKKGFTPLVRLNGTSDIKWENIYFDYTFMHGKVRSINIFELFPEIQFYDYTKIPNRDNLPKNYDLTYSYSGVLSYQKYLDIAIKKGMRIAAVFRTEKNIPKKYRGMICIPGDNTDIRHIEPKGVIVALYAKGKAKKDYSGFVIDNAMPVFALNSVN